MRIVPDEKNSEWILEFSNEKELQQFFDAVERDGSFQVLHTGIPRDATFRARAVGSPRSRKMRPLEIVREENALRVQMVRLASRTGEVGSSDQEEMVDYDPDALIGAPDQSSRTRIASLDEIRALPLSEKVYMALRADLQQRRALMRENHPKVQEFLLRNPRITEPEIAWLANNPVSPMQTILTIIQHKEWMGKDSVRTAILCNPKTPAHFVMEKIPFLSGADLRRMSRSQHLRNDVLNAVKDQMKKKGIPFKTAMD